MDGFYAARSRTIPPLPWTNFAPPFSRACELIREINPAGGWKGARDAWLDRAEDLSTMGLLRLPRC